MPVHIAMIVFSYYPEDPRVRREAEALAEAGMLVDVICLRRADEGRTLSLGNVKVFRLPISRRRAGMFRYLLQYASFFVLATLLLSWLQLIRRYGVVHVHNMPDLLVFTAVLPRLCGARLILDLHDPTPEVFMAKYSLPETNCVIRSLRMAEWASIRFVDLVLTPNSAFRDLFVGRGCPKEKIRIVMNSPDENIFRAVVKEPTLENSPTTLPFILMYHGTIVSRHGLSVALQAIELVRGRIKDVRFVVYGEGDFRDEFLSQVHAKRLDNVVRYYGQVSLEEIAQIIPTISVGLVPNNRNAFTEINFPTRIFEYLSLRKPVIVPRTKGILDYFDESSILLFEPGDHLSLAKSILKAYNDPVGLTTLLNRGVAVYQNHLWEHGKQDLVNVVKGLVRS